MTPSTPASHHVQYDYLGDFALEVPKLREQALQALAAQQALTDSMVVALLATSAPQLLDFKTGVVPDAANGNLPKAVVTVSTSRPVGLSIHDGKLRIVVGQSQPAGVST